AGMAQREQSGPNIPAVALAVADKTLGASGASGAQTATLSTAEDLIGLQIALKPASTSYNYDAQGNRTRKTLSTGTATTYAYDLADRLKTAGSASYAYNADGLRTAKTVGGVTSPYTWDVAEGLPL